MARSVTAFAAALVLIFAANAMAQSCDVSNTTNMVCDPSVTSGSTALCTLSVQNHGTADCVGNWTAALGSFDPATVSAVQGSSALLGSCTFFGDVVLPTPIFGQTVVHSATLCQGSGTLSPGATLSLTGRIAPGAGFTGSTLIAAYELTFRRTGGIPGTNSLTSYGGVQIGVNSCTATPTAPGAAHSGLPYVVSWNTTSAVGGYEIQEATSPDFSNATTLSEPTTARAFTHTVNSATTYYYRVRPVTCGGSSGSFGASAQVVVLPQQPSTSRDFDIVLPLGSTGSVSQSVTFSGLTPNTAFSASTDKPYLTVTPTSGTVRSDGTVTVTVVANPGNLPVGANTGTVSLSTASTPGGKGPTVPNDSRSSSTTVSVSMVTPVGLTAKGAPPNDALIVPAVAHLEGTVPFRSDVRITNTGTTDALYLLSFTPSNTDGTTSGRQTQFSIAAGQTVALNDVLKDFFGFALPSDQAGGVLEVRVLAGGSAATTFISSRTYAATAAGTYGQFIPAVPLAKFLKQGGNALTLTQVTQNSAFRTNVGLVEGFGANVSGRLRVFNASGTSLGEFPFSLRPFEFQQLGSFLATKGITADDARIEAVVDSATGGITTYASVLDQRTQDPLLVSPIASATVSANRYVLPGMADFTSPASNFHSDVRIFNASLLPVSATATFYPQGNGTPTVKSINIGVGEIKVYNNVLPTLFGVTPGGGAIVITTPANAPLIVSGRTYSNDAGTGGTFGQFIPAVTPADGVGVNDGPLQVLQLEQSANFRSNVGLNELTGNQVTVQVAAILPDSKTSPSTEVTLAPNEFRQLNAVLASLNPGNTYNARVTVKVTGGTGRVTAYGSVVDNLTSDPTYVPAQK